VLQKCKQEQEMMHVAATVCQQTKTKYDFSDMRLVLIGMEVTWKGNVASGGGVNINDAKHITSFSMEIVYGTTRSGYDFVDLSSKRIGRSGVSCITLHPCRYPLCVLDRCSVLQLLA
jgi:hypothetical protein